MFLVISDGLPFVQLYDPKMFIKLKLILFGSLIFFLFIIKNTTINLCLKTIQYLINQFFTNFGIL